VALRYRAIDDGVIKWDANNKTRVKALHIEVDKADPAMSWNRLEWLYSSAATVFPLEIKMRLVRELQLLTNADAKAKEASLQTTQQRFLANMDNCISWEIATLNLADKAMKASLRQLIMAIPDLDWPEHQLLHLVNKMYSNSGYIFWFKPAKAQSMREIVASLLVFLKGIWKDHIDMEKFNKFFMCLVIEWAKDA